MDAPTLADIRAARDRIRGQVMTTPLVRLYVDAPAEIWLKLETLQPIGSFKLRGATNKLALASDGELARGVYTASAGNMAQGVAWVARQRGVPCSVVVPDTAPEAKTSAITRLGAEIHKVPFAEWWDVLVTRSHPRYAERLFVHPVADPAVIAGNGTIGLEIAEQLPDVAQVIVPYGGGGLISGIATAIKALRPGVRVCAAEPETAAPLAPALAAGEPREIAFAPSFVDGSGSKSLLAEMWPIVRGLVDASFVVTLEQVAAAIRTLVERARIVAEGAGALPVAAALAGHASGKVVCVVSGGNIDRAKLATILEGRIP